MPKQKRTDIILILLALMIMAGAGSALYFDNWMWGGRRNHGERIGVLSLKSGDVRMKFEGDLKWQKAAPGQELIYNDSVYAGAGSQAELQIGESEMTVTENTLVVLRREDKVNFMNLSYGSLFGKVAKNEKVLIDTGQGKPIELLTSSDAHVMVRKNGARTELEIVSGEAQVTMNGKTRKVNRSSRIISGDDEPAKVEQLGLQLLYPLRNEVVYSEDPTRVDFKWKWSNDRKATANENFTLEFSSSPQFETLSSTRQIKGQLTTSVGATESVSLYYRVRGPRNELSQVEKVNFIRLHKPLIVKPLAQSQTLTPRGTNALVPVEFQSAINTSVLYEIASDSEFKNILANDTTQELKIVRELPVGGYFIRARSDFGSQHVTGWTDPVAFSVEAKMEVLKLIETPRQARVLIPNANYPTDWYNADPESVKGHLARRGLLRKFFPFAKDSFDQLQLKFGAEETLTQSSLSWPKEKLQPGSYTYAYQASKKGFEPAPWSEAKELIIAMDPPRALGNVHYGEVNEKGKSAASWNFTPLLFAKSYDVEIAHDPFLRRPRELKIDRPEVVTTLSGENYWRVRARDGQGRIISDFSPIYKLEAPVPQYLAKEEKPDRVPAEVVEEPAPERTVVRQDSVKEEEAEKSGWWTWLGAGANYLDYRQSIHDRGSFSDHHMKALSQFFEIGYGARSGWGGIVSVTQMPGEVKPSNAEIDNSSYKWTTIAGEGMFRETAHLLDIPVVYGMRVGLQQHRLPFVFVDGNDSLQLKNSTMTTASAGLLAEATLRRWTYYWMMRYQYPINSSADGSSQYSLSPLFGFDGSVGTSYNLTKRLKAGVFWSGQWHQFTFAYSDGIQANQGSQSLFYSDVDLRLGLDF